MRLQGKKIVITGGAGDIGKATALRFADEGARLALIDRDGDGLPKPAGSLSSALLLQADVTSEDDLKRTADTVRAEFGMIDALFINAGIEQSYVPVTEMDKETFERVVAVNLTGAFLTAKHFLPLVADDGSVIFTSSIAAMTAFPAYSAYSASKAGQIGLMKSVALDVANRRIRCNTIHPGPVRSRMLERSAPEGSGGVNIEQWFAGMASMARMGRLVQPNDVASLALFLASDESAMISSQSIVVDGGIV
ncbi:SDR family oxidoreductase [Sphingobium sp. CR2-8]|uniref:SDR family NAD(P)-dependent oxidoreductase n=1 Tax=Sphingobium sp. CR2-8 TaxID=1306534 RepID=UPI002DB99474|nr:SDR family oxidoreductase [Sphingobium sp. CR2-8]MEC3909594.1 SDR family oxidoreductase [Sphingobium sp. CR2-8]